MHRLNFLDDQPWDEVQDEDRSRKVRQAVFSDPDGNEFEVVQLVGEFAPPEG
jgi:catechol 2,3-dioxygenase-like lactoylglutathione lyase family enzyme